MSSTLLFVYGTLRRGSVNPHAQLLERSAEFVGRGKVHGRLYRVDWYPGMKLGGGVADFVVGDLFRVHDEEAMAELDRYEGSNEYQRVRAMAALEEGDQDHGRKEKGGQMECWVYEYIVPVNEESRIESGDWMA